MSEQQPEQDDQQSEAETDAGPGTVGDISDDQLPEDLQPSEDNPLARHPEQTGDESDQIGADREGDPERAPLSEGDADYGEKSDSGSSES
jgi:hypothetical protein